VSEDLYRTIFSRNIGFFTESEQEMLRRASVAIAGMGGVGGLLAERLTRLGVGKLNILDTESFELSNLNRQFNSTISNLGQNKAEATFKHLKDINPQAKISLCKTGIRTQTDASVFVSDCDLVIDEMEFGLFRESILLQRAARQKGIYYMFAIDVGFSALVVIFDPKGITLEEYDGLPSDIDLDSVEELKIPLEKVCPITPSYAAPVSPESEKILQEIIAGERQASTNGIGVGLASIMAANEAMNIILRKRDIVCAPRYTYLDLMDRQFLIASAL
jgi:molybdopterin/thiamine biosynthesis adenylyltransferase